MASSPSTSTPSGTPAPGQRSAKEVAGRAAAQLVQDGMLLGLGTGSTVSFFLEALAERIREEGTRVSGVPTSEQTSLHAEELGIPLTTLDQHSALDLAVDGADEVDGQLRLIKGGGGALLREKIVAAAAARVAIIVGEGKRVSRLGTNFLLPVEVTPFGASATQARVQEAGRCQAYLRTTHKGSPFVTDNGNYILDCRFEKGIRGPKSLHARLLEIPGVVEVGLFLDLCDLVLEGHADGSVETVTREDS